MLAGNCEGKTEIGQPDLPKMLTQRVTWPQVYSTQLRSRLVVTFPGDIFPLTQSNTSAYPMGLHSRHKSDWPGVTPAGLERGLEYFAGRLCQSNPPLGPEPPPVLPAPPRNVSFSPPNHFPITLLLSSMTSPTLSRGKPSCSISGVAQASPPGLLTLQVRKHASQHMCDTLCGTGSTTPANLQL